MTKFNPLTYANSLKKAGIAEPQATIFAEGFHEILETIENDFASKKDLSHLEQRLNNRMDQLDAKINIVETRINTVETVLAGKISNVDTKLNWLMSLMGAMGVLLALLNFIHFHC